MDIERESIKAGGSSNGSKHAVPKPRSPGIDLKTPIPRHWYKGNVFITHSINGVCMLFPAGERFFVRAVNHYMPEVKDEALRERVKGFFGQEGRHAKEHEKAFQLLEEQGYSIRGYLKFYETFGYDFLEKVLPHKLSLATTVALEHYTAILAEHALASDLLEGAHPRMQELLFWHAAEEIEHRAVAFDVMKEVEPSYAWRMAGLAMGTVCLVGFWAGATASLLLQEEKIPGGKLGKDMRVSAKRMRKHLPFWKGIKEYVRRDFHPNDHDTDHLATEYLEKSGLDRTPAAA
ncbi:MAG TPA: metal-dependent hydrolase [Polyangiaceae bacterium]